MAADATFVDLEELNLPKRLVLLDINGTLIASNSSDGHIGETDRDRLIQAIEDAAKQGWIVGLCSDSPLEPMRDFAMRAGLGSAAPIVAENGNLVHYDGRTSELRTLDDITALETSVLKVAAKIGLETSTPVLAPEFGGAGPPGPNAFAFGSGRTTSLTVFGPARLITELGRSLSPDPLNVNKISVDVSPQHGFFAMHPVENFREGKRRTLDQLVTAGIEVIMVGDSESDITNEGVPCTFVAGHSLSETSRARAAFVASDPLVGGVVQVLEAVPSIATAACRSLADSVDQGTRLT